MEKLKIPTGEWYKSERPIEQNEHGVYMLDIDTVGVISIMTVWSPNDPNNQEELDIVELCCDAGNTYQKCGLMPSELLEQRDRLLSSLKQIERGVTGLPLQTLQIIDSIEK